MSGGGKNEGVAIALGEASASPSPLTGEGWGEGENLPTFDASFFPNALTEPALDCCSYLQEMKG
jgi:hypothetical protein